MEKRKIIFISTIILVLIIAIILFLIFKNPKEVIYINFTDSQELSNTYKLKIDEKQNVSLKIEKQITSEEKNTLEYNITLTEDEMSKVTTIINYLNEEYDLSKDDYEFYFEYNDCKDKLSEVSLGIIENMLIGIESITMNESEFEGTTRREFGNNMLDNIINTQFIN